MFVKKQFIVDEPYQITQFLRGELYIIIDFCLSKVSHMVDSNIIRNFLENFLIFFNDYIDAFQINLKEVKS